MSDSGLKVPSLVFRWFEKMKTNYEKSIKSTLKHFENYTTEQQARVDKANQSHLDDLKSVHQQHIAQQQQTITNLKEDIDYYKNQIAKQQHTIEQLSHRYDATLKALLVNHDDHRKIKDVLENEISSQLKLNHAQSYDGNAPTELQSVDQQSHSTKTQRDIEHIYHEAMELRALGEHVIAFQLFQQAADLGCEKSLGALARAYFLSEGVESDQVKGLSYLIQAADAGLEQAINKAKFYQEHHPELYQQAQELLSQTKATA